MTAQPKKSLFETESKDTSVEDSTPVENSAPQVKPDLVKLAQDERKFKKKLADAHDKLVEGDEAIENAKTTVQEAKDLEAAKVAIKTWEKAEKARTRLQEQKNSYQDLLDAVKSKMKEALE